MPCAKPCDACKVGLPRLVLEKSYISSWTKVAVCISSAARARSITLDVSLPPAHSKANNVNTGRYLFPPASKTSRAKTIAGACLLDIFS